MSNVEHYETLLADVYDWMMGGAETKIEANRSLLTGLGLTPNLTEAIAADIGAGSGYQSVPLAEMGYQVVAIDPSAKMLDQLDKRSGSLPITTTIGEAATFAQHLQEPVQLIVCMGDTLAHFGSHVDIEEFISMSHDALAPGGRLVVSYRDSSTLPVGDGRFLPIKSDHSKIFTCFLEEVDENTVRVHDIVHTVKHGTDGFEQQVSSYTKLRLNPTWMNNVLENTGFGITSDSNTGGLNTTLAVKPAA